MKNKRTCGSRITCSTVLVCSSFIATVTLGRSSDKLQPVGTSMGAVRFDAVIELNRYSPRSDRHDYTMLFTRYWVARDYYAAAVVWAEPLSTDLYFTLTKPPGLCVVSSKQTFNICHDSIKSEDETHTKPLDERDVLRHRFGVYPVSDIRFAEREALAERIYTADLRNWEDSNQTDEGVFDIAGGNNRDVARLKVSSNGQQITSLQLFNAEQRMLKDISYEYESKGGKSLLRRQTVALHERPMMVGFNGKGMRVTLDGKEHWYRDLETRHHAGGRRCTVEYELVDLGDTEVSLPVKVTVCNAKDGRLLRCVRMMNFKQVELDTAGGEQAARQFGAATPDQRRYEQLQLKYWKKAPAEIEKADFEAIEQLRRRFEEAAGAAGSSAGEKLKYLNILVQLDSILSDHSELERHYKSYLVTLRDNKLTWMTLVGGFGFIETAMFAKQHAIGRGLLNVWVDTVVEMHEDEAVLLFARRQLAKSRSWETIKMLEALLARKDCSSGARFEANSLQCIALDGLCKLLETDDIAKKGLIAEIQAAWVSSIGREDLDRMLADNMDRASLCFAQLSDPTESQRELKKQLDKIEKEASAQQKDAG